MSVVSVKARSFILALFIRDDGERFLLGDNGYDFKDSQLHFAANTIENDEVMKQGADGVMVAGQVRRASVQSFDGFVGDATMAKETIEQMRRDFFAFFIKGHHFRVVYIDCNRNAWQRKGGYLVDAPEVKELWQIHPEYHVGLNFEDVNYYSYDEDADGNEILANLVNVPVSTEIEGGLVWDEDGAVSEDASDIYYDTATATATPGKIVNITDATEAPIASFQLNGETSQNGTPTPDAPIPVKTVTGENVVKICGKNLFNLATPATNNGVTVTANADGSFTLNGTTTGVAIFNFILPDLKPAGTYTISCTSKNQVMDDGFFVRARNQNMGMLVPGGENGPSQIRGIGTNYVEKTFISTDPMYCLALNLTTTGVTYNNMIIYPQVEVGSQATAYEPYQCQSFTLSLGTFELCKIGDYQDYIYKSGDKWYVRKEVGKVVLDGSESWTSVFSEVWGNNAYLCSSITNFKAWGGTLSNYFKDAGLTQAAILSNGYMQMAGSGIVIRNNNTTSVSNLKTWLTANPTTVYYVLATPTDTEITNEALIEQLEAILSQGSTYAGTNNITTVISAGNEQGELEISYYTKYQPMVGSGGYVWEAGGAGGATIVVNNSIDSVNPIWKIYGPTMNPQLENSTTGEVIEYVGMIAEGQTLTIDMGEQTASLDGLNVISNLVGDFISLVPGANRLINSVSGDAGASEIGWSEIVG